MAVTREMIITTLRAHLEALPEVLACWLEGADAADRVDAYSDIDLCAALLPGSMDAAEGAARAALRALGECDLDLCYVNEPNQRHLIFHLTASPAHTILDLVFYIGCGSDFIEGDAVERPLILFDRSGAVRFHPAAEQLAALNLPARRQALRGMLAQSSRVDKYLARGEFIEAFGYYRRYLLEPLIEALRLRYTPLHPDYGIVHISRHLPPEVTARLERLHQAVNLADLANNAAQARAWLTDELDSNSPADNTQEGA